MSNDTIFFSYSRDNSEFVLNLAKELRNAGANIWLDQLDIKPGTRWDSSIEKALASSKTLLVILSKSSVDSHNVMDEVSYALEEKKTVVPVLLEPCDIPFRLKRLQYADFTGDHSKGIKNLIETLNLGSKVSAKLSESINDGEKSPKPKVETVVKPEVQKNEEPKPAPVKTSQQPSGATYTPKKKSKSKAPFFIGIIVGVILIIVVLIMMTGDSETEIDSLSENPTVNDTYIDESLTDFEKDWELVKNSSSIEDFIVYGMVYGEYDGFDYDERIVNPIDNLFMYEVLVIFGYPDGLRPFNNVYYLDENGNLNWMDDNLKAEEGNLLKSKRSEDLFDLQNGQLIGTMQPGQIVKVLIAYDEADDGYIYAKVAIGDYSQVIE